MPTGELILPTIVNLVATVIVFFGVINIILATLRYRHLQHSCNYLIAINAFSDFSGQFTYFIFSSYLFSGILYTTRLTCVYWHLVPSLLGQCGLSLTLGIGFDRMIAVVMPLRYHKLKSIFYISAIVSLSIIFSTWYSVSNFLYTLTTPNDTIICFATTVTHPGFYVTKNYGQGIICGSILIVYSITWMVLLKKKSANNNLKQILKPLTIIMLMVVFTWPLTILLVTLARQFIPPEQTLTVTLYIVWITNFGRASDYFIFFAFSKDYRKAFLQQLLWVPYFGKFVHPQVSLVQTAFFKKNMTNPIQPSMT